MRQSCTFSGGRHGLGAKIDHKLAFSRTCAFAGGNKAKEVTPKQQSANGRGGKLSRVFVSSGHVTDGFEEGVVVVSSHAARTQPAPSPANALSGVLSLFPGKNHPGTEALVGSSLKCAECAHSRALLSVGNVTQQTRAHAQTSAWY